VSFVYEARRPFNNPRLNDALQAWPVAKKDCLGEMLAESPESAERHPMSRVIRSKGFAWIDEYPSSRMYWSHAGKNMVLQFEGLWWGAMHEKQIRMMEQLNQGEYDRVRAEEWKEPWADRRQELVFIGQSLDEAGIREILDDCLLTDEELKEYKLKQDEDARDLREEWSKGMVDDVGGMGFEDVRME